MEVFSRESAGSISALNELESKRSGRLRSMISAEWCSRRPRVWNSDAQPFTALQEVDGFASSRAGARKRLANPSELYRGADGLSNGMDRNRAIGNAVVPDLAEWIGRKLVSGFIDSVNGEEG